MERIIPNERMNNCVISEIIDISNIKLSILDKLNNIMLQKDFYEKLDEINTFFNSDIWNSINKENPESSHNSAYNYLLGKFGNTVSIYDTNFIYGKDVFDNLSKYQKEFIKQIDSNKTSGIHKIGNIFVRYIRSTVIINLPSQTWSSIPTWGSSGGGN